MTNYRALIEVSRDVKFHGGKSYSSPAFANRSDAISFGFRAAKAFGGPAKASYCVEETSADALVDRGATFCLGTTKNYVEVAAFAA